MADLIAIGYPDETTALAAMDETELLQRDLKSSLSNESQRELQEALHGEGSGQ